jgi:hypothetical protein
MLDTISQVKIEQRKECIVVTYIETMGDDLETLELWPSPLHPTRGGGGCGNRVATVVLGTDYTVLMDIKILASVRGIGKKIGQTKIRKK